MTSAMNEMHSQVDTLNAKLNDVSTQAAAAATALQAASDDTERRQRRFANSGRQVSRQLKQLEATLTDQQQQLKDTQDLVTKTAPTWKASSVRRRRTEWIDRDDARRTDCAAEARRTKLF